MANFRESKKERQRRGRKRETQRRREKERVGRQREGHTMIQIYREKERQLIGEKERRDK
jgi:hypothetical protein